MAAIPITQTGTPARYPLVSHAQYRNGAVSFVDGDVQRYPLRREPQRFWKLEFNELDGTECANWLEFLNQEIRAQSSFVYLDPVTGLPYSNSFLNDKETSVKQLGVNNARVALTIRNEGI